MKRLLFACGVALLLAAQAGGLELNGTTRGDFGWGEAAASAGAAGTVGVQRRLSEDGLIRVSGSVALESSSEDATRVEIFLEEAFFTDTWTRGSLATGGIDVLTLTAGRFPFTEATGLGAPLVADGARLSWKRPGLVVEGFAATTALLPAGRGLVLTQADAAEPGGTRPIGDGSTVAVGPFPPGSAPDRVLAGIVVALPERLGLANLSGQYVAQIDGRTLAGPSAGDDTLSVNYVSGVIAFPVSRLVFATTSVTGALGRYRTPAGTEIGITSALASLEVRGYLERSSRPTGSLAALWASGSGETGALPAGPDDSTVFPPGPFAAPWEIAPVALRNVAATTATATLLPFAGAGALLEDTLLSATTTALFKPAPGSSGSDAVTMTDRAGWYGVEMHASIAFRPFHDLEISAGGAIFLPATSDNGGVLAAGTERSWQISATARVLW